MSIPDYNRPWPASEDYRTPQREPTFEEERQWKAKQEEREIRNLDRMAAVQSEDEKAMIQFMNALMETNLLTNQLIRLCRDMRGAAPRDILDICISLRDNISHIQEYAFQKGRADERAKGAQQGSGTST